MVRVMCSTGTRARDLAATALSFLAAPLGEDRIDYLHDHALPGLLQYEPHTGVEFVSPTVRRTSRSWLHCLAHAVNESPDIVPRGGLLVLCQFLLRTLTTRASDATLCALVAREVSIACVFARVAPREACVEHAVLVSTAADSSGPGVPGDGVTGVLPVGGARFFGVLQLPPPACGVAAASEPQSNIARFPHEKRLTIPSLA
jgi:hypothetical protein